MCLLQGGETMVTDPNEDPGEVGGEQEQQGDPLPGAKKDQVLDTSIGKGVERLRMGGRNYRIARAEEGGKQRSLDILPDLPDIRDRIYIPHLRSLEPAIYPRIAFAVRDQGEEPSCTGHSLAHIIDFLRFREVGPDLPGQVSAKMLYEMARRNDEWAESPHEGSSLRGALKGFYRNGVCREVTGRGKRGQWALSYEMAKEALETRLGAYFRVHPDVTDYHAAINDVGAIYVSAQIHENWRNPVAGRIEPGGAPIGGHAFVVVGYDAEGFWVLNSWGERWGQDGVAHWAYRDWAATIMDAWVLQLGVRAPAAFGAIPNLPLAGTTGLFGWGDPARADIVGHFVNINDGRLEERGKYASPTANEMKETVERLASSASNSKEGFDHLIIYAHGGLNSEEAEARRIAAWKKSDIFGRNGIYNFHLMWASDFLDEAFGSMSTSTQGLAGSGSADWLFEAGFLKKLGQRAWRNMKSDAEAAFSDRPDYMGGIRALTPLFSGLAKAKRRPKLHLVGHSAGAIVLGRMLSALDRLALGQLDLASIHLMAPACTTDFFNEHYGPYAKGQGAHPLSGKIHLYNLSAQLELDDEVSSNLPLVPRYSHSLLYLVSRAYEEEPGKPIAGMELHQAKLKHAGELVINLSAADSAVTSATTHGGFDNDAPTLNTIMEAILGHKPKHPAVESEVQGY